MSCVALSNHLSSLKKPFKFQVKWTWLLDEAIALCVCVCVSTHAYVFLSGGDFYLTAHSSIRTFVTKGTQIMVPTEPDICVCVNEMLCIFL